MSKELKLRTGHFLLVLFFRPEVGNEFKIQSTHWLAMVT